MNSSSSSSSACYCDDCYCYRVDSNTKSHRHLWSHPFYWNTTQPLVYYAQVPPTCTQPGSKKTRRTSPNCFVKAFKWYTQEHVPTERNQFLNFNPTVTGFAAWLDTKYQQFVRESQQDQTYFLKLQQTSSIEAYKMIKETKSKTKRKSRVKRSYHSFEYILQPKEMTRDNSEWCQPTPTSLRNRSNVAIVSAEVCNCKKPAKKCLSLTSVHQDNISNSTYLSRETADGKIDTNDRPIVKTLKTRNILCQCAAKVASKISTETQYEKPQMNAVKSDQLVIKRKLLPGQIYGPSSSKLEVIIKSLDEMPKGTVKKMVQEFDPRRHISCQCTENVNKRDTSCQCDTWTPINASKETTIPIVNDSTSCSSRQLKSALTNTVMGSNGLKLTTHSAAQTSDHPIDLSNDLFQQYPFFMRIVCADKLCDSCIKR